MRPFKGLDPPRAIFYNSSSNRFWPTATAASIMRLMITRARPASIARPALGEWSLNNGIGRRQTQPGPDRPSYLGSGRASMGKL